jgi:hypothetical protein
MLLLKDAKLSMLTSRRVTIFLSILLLALKTEELRLEKAQKETRRLPRARLLAQASNQLVARQLNSQNKEGKAMTLCVDHT